ncbi:MAG: phosphopentomutase [Candidatus Gastranaerophilales bacterium]|nr:phosphopentomutase [Candidatus Gastranaerophilales bacterium]
MKRVILIVIDSMGCGAMPDCREYGDVPECNTLCNVAKAVNGLNAPNFFKLGLGNLGNVEGIPYNSSPIAQWGIMKEKSKGKDTTTGHWEMMGLILDNPFKVYPNGFPDEIIQEFIKKTNCGGILANYPASGTKVIEDLHAEHSKTKYPIIYTSADSVFQIAADIDVIPIEKLYSFCRVAREILTDEYNVSRVIARPYKMDNNKPVRIGALRRDFSVEPFKDSTCDNIINNNGIVLGIGKIEDIFVGKGISHAIHTSGNTQGLDITLKAVKNELNLNDLKTKNYNIKTFDKMFIFTNLVDTDMLYGHRNDYKGYAKAIEEIDSYLPKIIQSMTNEDLLIITADHGCDPTVKGTDHTREQVPLIIYSKNITPSQLPAINTFSYISERINNWLEI